MGTDNIELGPGTLYFSAEDAYEKLGDVTDFEVCTDDSTPYISFTNFDAMKECSFTCECQISFRMEMMFFGFWQALKRRIRMIFTKSNNA